VQAVVVVGHPHVPPIYDGIGFPDEPYRFVDPPAGYRETQAATPAEQSVPAASGHTTRAVTVNSSESGPQVSLLLEAGAVRTPAEVSSVMVRAEPVHLTGDKPPGYVWGNVYRVGFTTADGAAQQASGAEAKIQLRSPSLQSGPTLYVRHAGGGWTALHTVQPGRDIWGADLAGVGEYVLAGEDPLNIKAKDPNSEGNVGWFGLIASAVLVALVIVLFLRAERRRSRRRAH
jgi:hypothetical protein